MCVLIFHIRLCQTFLQVAVKGEYHPINKMSRTSATRNTWHPQTSQERDQILRELHEVLASPHFCNSKRYPALLQYVVENTLAGKSDLLKERTLGVEVFDRLPTYDTNTDTVVRYTAGEVRKRLLLYYHEHGRSSPIRISLPAGSYIPEFLHGDDEPEEIADYAISALTHISDASGRANSVSEAPDAGPHSSPALASRTSRLATGAEIDASPLSGRRKAVDRRVLWLALAALVAMIAIAGLRWRDRAVNPQTAVDDFWGPVLREQRTVSICFGAVVFAQNNFSGTLTAGKDIEYPFVSVQGASAIALISGLLQHAEVTAQLQSAPSTPLTELREHSVILLGGYNNQWTLRLLQPLRFHFTPEPVESIIDQMHPGVQWSRDHSLPYSSADDYALVARYRDATTDSWVVVLAGLGRNGSEAAAQFASSPHYMQLLREQIGKDFSNRNVEAVLKVSVIDGKTGAPSIVAVHAW